MTPASPGRFPGHHFLAFKAGPGFVYKPGKPCESCRQPDCSDSFGEQGASPLGDSGPPAGGLALPGWLPRAGWPRGTVGTALCWQDLLYCFIFIFVSSSPLLFRFPLDTVCALPLPSLLALKTCTCLHFLFVEGSGAPSVGREAPAVGRAEKAQAVPLCRDSPQPRPACSVWGCAHTIHAQVAGREGAGRLPPPPGAREVAAHVRGTGRPAGQLVGGQATLSALCFSLQ